MANTNLTTELQSIIKEGFLDKQSRVLKSWRSRWFVLTPNTFLSFKERKVYNSPTETIPLKDIITIKSCQDPSKQFTFKIETNETAFYLCASSNMQKQQWIGQITKNMMKITMSKEQKQQE